LFSTTTSIHSNKKSDNKLENKSAGFTLLEVLVALSILALSLGAAIKTTSSSLQNASYLQQRTLAHWVAMNKLTEMDVFSQWPSPGSKDTGTMLMAGHEWYWQVEARKSDDIGEYSVGVATVTVRASEDDKNPMATLVGAYPI